MADEPEVTFRVNSARDTDLSIREDMMLDIVDMLKDISTGNEYRTDPVKNILFRTDAIHDNELPCNVVFDHEATCECVNRNWKHTLNITIAHITSEGKDTSTALSKGSADVLKCFGKFHNAFCSKYSIPPVELTESEKGQENADKTRGEMDLVFQIKYNTPAWQF